MSRDDRKRLYTYGELPDQTALEIHLDYQYTYDDILLIWNARCDLLLRWVKQQNVPAENIRPIIRPDYEISYQAKRGEAGSLRKYLNDERRDAALEKKDNKSRLIVIPLNTGGHWVTLMLDIQEDNTLASAAYIDSLYKDQDVPDESHLGLLSKSHYIVEEITEVYPEFNQQVHLFAHYIQSDQKACGVLGIENAMAFIKWSYTKGSTIECQLQPMRCDDDRMAQLRGMHLQLIGGTNNPLYTKQRDNVNDIADAETQFLILDHLKRSTVLEEKGIAVVSLIRALSPSYQATLCAAFSAEPDEPHASHLLRLRTALFKVFQTVHHEDEKFPSKAAYKRLLEMLYGGPFESFKAEKDFKKSFQKPLDDYEQIKAVGAVLAPLWRPSVFNLQRDARTLQEAYRQLVKPLVDEAMRTASYWEKTFAFGESPAKALRAAARRLWDRPLRSLYRWSSELFQLLSEASDSPRYQKRLESLYLVWLQEGGERSLGEAHRSVPPFSELSEPTDVDLVERALWYELDLWDQAKPGPYRLKPMSNAIKQDPKKCKEGVFYVELKEGGIQYLALGMSEPSEITFNRSVMKVLPSTLEALAPLKRAIIQKALRRGHLHPEKGKLYFKKKGDVLEYMVIDPCGRKVMDRIRELPHVFNEPLDVKELKRFYSKILAITSARGHTFPVVSKDTREAALERLGQGHDAFVNNRLSVQTLRVDPDAAHRAGSSLEVLIASMEAWLHTFRQWWKERQRQDDITPELKKKFEQRITDVINLIQRLESMTSQNAVRVLDSVVLSLHTRLKDHRALVEAGEDNTQLALFEDQEEWALVRQELPWEQMLEKTLEGLQALQKDSNALEQPLMRGLKSTLMGISAVESKLVKVVPNALESFLKMSKGGLIFALELLHFISATKLLKTIEAGLHTAEALVKYFQVGHGVAEFLEKLHFFEYMQKKWEKKTGDYSLRTQQKHLLSGFPFSEKESARVELLIKRLLHAYGDSLSRLTPESQGLFAGYLLGMALSYCRQDFLSEKARDDGEAFVEELLQWLAFSQYAMNALSEAAQLSQADTEVTLTLCGGGTVLASEVLSRSGYLCQDAQGKLFLYWYEGQSPGLYGSRHSTKAEVQKHHQRVKAKHVSGSRVPYRPYRLEPLSERIRLGWSPCDEGIIYVSVNDRCITYRVSGMEKAREIWKAGWKGRMPSSFKELESVKNTLLEITTQRGDTRHELSLYYGGDLKHYDVEKEFRVIPFAWKPLFVRVEEGEKKVETHASLLETIYQQIGLMLQQLGILSQDQPQGVEAAGKAFIEKAQKDRAEVKKLKKTVMDQQVMINGLATKVETLESDKKQLEQRLKKQEIEMKEVRELLKLRQPVEKGAEPERREDQGPPIRDDVAENPHAENASQFSESQRDKVWSSLSVFESPSHVVPPVNQEVGKANEGLTALNLSSV